MQPVPEFATLVELLRWRALGQPDRRAYVFLSDGEREDSHLTYATLDRQARIIAARLQKLNAEGERVLLLYASGLPFIAAFFGCLYAGAVAVPAYPPRPNRKVERIQAIVENAGAIIALTTANLLARLESAPEEAGLRSLRWLTTDDVPAQSEDAAREWQAPLVESGALAFLQYTSGSTAQPKGVMVSHGNLLANHRMIAQAFEHGPDSTFVGWLPLFHDMGLIGNVLQPLFLGSASVLMPPEAFLVKPFRWLNAISRYKAHTSGGPNFSYDLCVRKITPEQRASLDLSHWQVAFSGAEPVRAATLRQFTATFQLCGFNAKAFYPCYGLAEASLFVTGGAKGASPVRVSVLAEALERDQVEVAEAAGTKMVGSEQDGTERRDVRMLVSCGHTWLNQEITIVDPTSLTQCEPGQVGEIWVQGANVAQGYWNREQETAYTFKAHRADTSAGPCLRTGDLGFMHQGELFITGRLKDLIIIGGRNHYPEDLEQTAEASHPAVRPGCCAAFSVDAGGEERLVIVAETERRPGLEHRAAKNQGDTFETIAAAIRQAIAQQHDLRAHAVCLLKPYTLPKTSSGKVQRHLCRAGFLTGSLSALWTG